MHFYSTWSHSQTV